MPTKSKSSSPATKADVIRSQEQLASMMAKSFSHQDKKFNRLEKRFDNLETRFDNLENRFDHLENRFDNLEDKVTNIEKTMATKEEMLHILDIVRSIDSKVTEVVTTHAMRLGRLERTAFKN